MANGTATEGTTLVVTIEAELDRLEKNMRAAGRIVDTTTSGMDKSTKRAAIAVAKLEAAFDPAARAARRLETDSRKVQQALEKGAITSQKAAEVQKRLNDQYERAAASAGHMGMAVEAGTNRLSAGVSRQRSFALATQNSAYQIGDFAVQVAAGTDATRALAMQLPQLLGGFGVVGAVIGAVVAIAGALVPVFMDGAGATKEAAKEAEKYAEALKEAKKQTEELARKNAGLFAGPLADPFARGVEAAQARVDQLRASIREQRALETSTIKTGVPVALERYVDMLVRGSDEANAFAKAQEELNKAIAIQADLADRTIGAMVKENAYREDGLALLRSGLITLEEYEAQQKAGIEAAKLGIDIRDKVTRSYTDQYVAILNAVKATMALDKAEADLKKTREIDTSGFLVQPVESGADFDRFNAAVKIGHKELDTLRKNDERARERILADYDRMREAGGDSVAALEDWRMRSLEGLDSAAAGYDEFARKVEEIFTQRLPDARRRDLINSREWYAGAQVAFEDYADAVTNDASRANAAVTSGMKGMEDALVGWTSRTKSAGDSFRGFVDGVVLDMQRMLIQKGVTGPLSGILGGLVDDIFGGGAVNIGGVPSGGIMSSSPLPVVLNHNGGMGSSEPSGFRSINPSIFSGAPRYHSGRVPGLASFEEPAIIKKDEGVFTQGQMKAMGARMGGGSNITLTDARVINVNGGSGDVQAQVEAALAAEKPKWTREAVNQSKIAVARENISNPNYLRA